MKVFCRSKDLPDDFIELAEVTFQATPEELRLLASYFENSAKDFETHDGMCHNHFQDMCKEWCDNWPDVIAITPPRKVKL